MKRCPTEAGGCGELVDMLFDSGLCQKCDAMVTRGTAAAGGPPRRRGRKPGGNGPTDKERLGASPACAKYVKGDERGICANCGAKRAAHGKIDVTPKAMHTVVPPALCKRGCGQPRHRGPCSTAPAIRKPRATDPDSPQMAIERLRSQYTEEYDRAQAAVKTCLGKLEVLEELEAEMKKV